MGKKGNLRTQKPSLLDVWMELLLGCFIVVYLLSIHLPGAGKSAGYSGISEMKTILFYVLAGILLVYGLIRFGVEALEAKRRNRRLRGLTASQLAALAFLLFTLLSAACSPYPEQAWYSKSAHEAALTVSLYVLLFLIVSRWGKPTVRLWRAFLCAMGLFCLLCAVQALGGNPFTLYPKGMTYYDGYDVRYKGAYAGTIGNVDLVSAFFALGIPLILLPALGRKLRQGWPCWLLTLCSVGLLIWLRVLCGIVGLAAGAAISVLVLCPSGKRRWVLLAYGLLGAAALFVLWRFDFSLKSLHELHELLHGRADDTFGTGRFYIWRQMLERIPDRLWLGVGPDAARFSKLSPFVRYDEAGTVVARATITDAHCYPLHILYCQGLPALLSWLTAVGLSLTHWVRRRAERSIAALGSGLTCFLCAMLFCFSSVIIMPFFWLTMGLLEAASQKQDG